MSVGDTSSSSSSVRPSVMPLSSAPASLLDDGSACASSGPPSLVSDSSGDSSGPPRLVTDSDDSSSEEDEDDSPRRRPPTRRAAARTASPPCAHNLSFESREESGADCSHCELGDDHSSDNEAGLRQVMSERADGTSGTTDRRGTYDRRGEEGQAPRGRRKSHAEYAYTHLKKVESFSIGRPCTTACPFGQKCGMEITPRTLLACHQHSFGTNTACVEEESDEGVIAPKYTCEYRQSKTMEIWRTLVNSFITWDVTHGPEGERRTRVERFTVNKLGPVCANYCAAAYGITDIDDMLAKARSGALEASAVENNVMSGLQSAGGLGARAMRDTQRSTSKEECVEWWKLWLQLEDQMPNEPVIVHRIVVWSSVYEEEYLLDMQWWGSSAALSLQRWTTLRLQALRELSLEWFGADLKTDPTGMTPMTMVVLRRRASHSKFPPCPECESAKAMWLQFRTGADRRRVQTIYI